MTGFIAIIIVLGGLIAFHELGHFLAARLLGIGVKTFSVGFGPKLFGFKGRKTQYQVALVPLGGFVSLVGEGGKDEEIPEPFTREESFALRPPLHRLFVVLAGPFFNIVLACFIYAGLLLGSAMQLPAIGEVIPYSPAAEAGIRPGDVITSINGHPVAWWDDIRLRVNMEKSRILEVGLKRGEEKLALRLAPSVLTFKDDAGKEVTVRQIGVASAGIYYKENLPESLLESCRETWRAIVFTGEMLGMLVKGDVSVKEIGGPVLIGQMVHDQASKHAYLALLTLSALLSINLGLLNLLPIPALDGGHVFFNLCEITFRRPVPEKIQTYGTMAGLALMLALMVLVTLNDIYRWVAG